MPSENTESMNYSAAVTANEQVRSKPLNETLFAKKNVAQAHKERHYSDCEPNGTTSAYICTGLGP